MTARLIAGLILTSVGAAATFRLIPFLTDYSYAILWWGVLLLTDLWNSRRHGLSIWNWRCFAIILPFSVLMWDVFEVLNLPAPQWHYRVGVPGMWPKVLVLFASFATVIPIMVEAWWLVAGRTCIPADLLGAFRRYRFAWLLLAF